MLTLQESIMHPPTRGLNNDTLSANFISMLCSSRHGIVCLYDTATMVEKSLESRFPIIMKLIFSNYLLNIRAVPLNTTRLDNLEDTILAISFLNIPDILSDNQRCPSSWHSLHVDFPHKVASGQLATENSSTLQTSFPSRFRTEITKNMAHLISTRN